MIETMEDLQALAWRDFISYAWNDPDMRRGFEKATGHKLGSRVAPGSLEAMIDEATGKAADDAMAFTAWATDRWFGWDGLPEKARVELQAVLDKKGWRRD
ncbi:MULTISPECIES: hypothetical protein [unclassified Chelatococcus]|uniref:hypothetical protein n=1 Tax=unclassified Chelatococcus TaxID=2638111 RepID=UPI001BD01C21|nr:MULTISPECIES: hypothetical protein [unclassified Chelatococcus]MBS7696244.1 hypothetical protein [Chelatococcus sp. YT9]MBX3560072.1 hypothetical protein [Chelatococcus sp.]